MVTVPCHDVRFSNFFTALGRPCASYAARNAGLWSPSELVAMLTPEPGLETSERGDEDEVGMDRGENRGEDAEADVVELDLACCEFDGEIEAEAAAGMETCGSCVWEEG